MIEYNKNLLFPLFQAELLVLHQNANGSETLMVYDINQQKCITAANNASIV